MECSICGCTDAKPCNRRDEQTQLDEECFWLPRAPAQEPLCSFCAELAAEMAMAFTRGYQQPEQHVRLANEADCIAAVADWRREERRRLNALRNHESYERNIPKP